MNLGYCYYSNLSDRKTIYSEERFRDGWESIRYFSCQAETEEFRGWIQNMVNELDPDRFKTKFEVKDYEVTD